MENSKHITKEQASAITEKLYKLIEDAIGDNSMSYLLFTSADNGETLSGSKGGKVYDTHSGAYCCNVLTNV